MKIVLKKVPLSKNSPFEGEKRRSKDFAWQTFFVLLSSNGTLCLA